VVQTFKQRHYWAASLGPALCIGLSTVRFRSHRYSAHEVYVDPQQLAWFEEQLRAAEGRPVVVFTHAPPLGCGLKAVEVGLELSFQEFQILARLFFPA